MKRYVIIITHTETIDEVRQTINSIAFDCDGVVLVCDRNESVSTLCKEYDNVISFNINKGESGRLTSTSRNFGLRIIESFWKPNPDDLIFYIDGDRKFVHGTPAAATGDADVELIRVEEDYRYGDGWEPYTNYGGLENHFNSNGLVFKYSAICKLKDTFGFVFPEDVQYEYGIEDRCLGDMCYHCGLSAEFNTNIVQYGKYDIMELPNATFFKRLDFVIGRYNLDVKFNPKK